MNTCKDSHHSPSVVLYPSPGMGHLRPMLHLADLLDRHGLCVTILTVEPHYSHGPSPTSLIAAFSASHPSVSFHRLPSVSPPPTTSRHRAARAFDLLRLSNPNLLSFLQSISPKPAAIIADFFCSLVVDVTDDLRIPTYIFFPSGGSFYALFLHFQDLHSRTSASLRDMGPTVLEIPGLAPLRADHLPVPVLDRDDDAYRSFLNISANLRRAAGVIVNTFDALEPRAVAAASAASFPPLYCIGPVIKEEREPSLSPCLEWLDGQPKESVVFLCFGSMATFSEAQLREIAAGLERSGMRFLWVVKGVPVEDNKKQFSAPPEPDLDLLLPEGFLERTEGRGMVVKSWAPQAAVLKHESVGGFVSHCGWNSTLEAMTAGVPMIAWPQHAEQRMNMVFLVEEAKVAVEMRGYDEELVSGDEVAAKVRWLMESEGGRELRASAVEARESAVKAMGENGSSYTALLNLVARLTQKHVDE